jgi:hypothetical protein
MSGKVRAVAVWAATGLVAAGAVLVGVLVLLDPRGDFARKFPDWPWLRHVVGVSAVAGAVLLFVPRLGWLGATLLAVLVAGDLFAHATHNETDQLPVLGVLLAALLCLAYLRRPRRAPSPPVKAQQGPAKVR